MKIFKRLIQFKVNKYALKRKNSLSKSSCYQQLAIDYYRLHKHYPLVTSYLESAHHYILLSTSEENLANEYLKKLLALDEKYGISKDYAQKADYYRYLADLYDDKKNDLEEHKG